MAVNKNFVVKNGLEVDTDLIFADASTNKVGIGSTIPASMLDVKGGIAVTDINASGVGTIVTLKSTTGIITTVDAISLQATNLVITGVSTGITLGSLDELLVTGVTSTGSLQVVGTGNMPVGIITNAQGTNINYSGIGTIANVIFTKDASGVGATIGAAVGMVTYYGDGVNLLNTGGGIGIGSTQGIVGYGFTTLNFIGAGNTFKTDGTSIDISISGGGGGGSVSIGSEAPSSPSSGSLWYHTEYGRTFVYFDEEALGIGNTAVWVDAAPFNMGGKFVSKYGDNAFGAIGYTGGTTSQASIYYTSDPNTGIYFPSTDHVGVVAGGTASLVVNPNGISVTGIITGNGSGLTGVASTDNINTGTSATFTSNVNVSGVTSLGTANSGSLDVVGMTTLRNDINIIGSQAGVTSITWDASNDKLLFQDITKLAIGAGSDLQIYHNGTHNYLDSSNGNIYLRVNSTESAIKCTENGNVEISYNGAKTLETTANGVTIFDDGKDAEAKLIVQGGEGNAASLYLYADDGDDNADKWRILGDNSAPDLYIQNYASGSWESSLRAVANGAVVLYNDNSQKFHTSPGGVVITGVCTATSFVGDGSLITGIAAGGSGEFNTSISGATQYDVTTSMATALTANASSDHRTIVHSIHICNISASEASISGEIQSSFSLAHNIPVPAGSAVELLKQPKVLGPSETIELQSDTASALEATIIIEYKEDTDFWDAAIDLTSAATLTDIYTSTTNPSVVQSILLANDDGSNDVKARVAWTDGSNNIQSYLCYDMVIPAESTVELCEKPKYLAAGYKLRGYANVADRLEITASGKQITS
jgi:hypothetical protein